MSEEQTESPSETFEFPKSTPKKLQEEIEKRIPAEFHEKAIEILRDDEKQALRKTLLEQPYRLSPNMVSMLLKNYYYYNCDTADILDKAGQLLRLMSKNK